MFETITYLLKKLNMYQRSIRKESFLRDLHCNADFICKLKASELPSIVWHLSQKLGVKILINGQHSSIKEAWDKIDDDTQKQIERLHASSFRNMEFSKIKIQWQSRQRKKKLIKFEVKAIQESLASGTFVGYVFTNGENKAALHFEVIIITDKSIIKPLNWQTGFTQDIDNHINEMHIMYSVAFPGMNEIRAQANDYGCGPLGLLYIKELLKNNADQLKQYSMTFSSGGNNYFFPPPQPLRYSQSRFYNNCLFAMLEDGDAHGQVVVVGNKKAVQLTTLKTLLNLNPDQNKELLVNFEEFKTRWKNVYSIAMEKRKSMQKASEQNKYLDYRTYTIKKGVRLFFASQDKTNIKLSEWNSGDYFLLTHQRENNRNLEYFYYVDINSVKYSIQGVHLQNIYDLTDEGSPITFIDEALAQNFKRGI